MFIIQRRKPNSNSPQTSLEIHPTHEASRYNKNIAKGNTLRNQLEANEVNFLNLLNNRFIVHHLEV